MLRLIDNRLKQSDCRLRGWILDGFPESEAQVNLLKALRIKPSLVCIFEQTVDESVRRLSNRKIDPVTGETFNTEVNPPKAESQTMRLQSQKQDEDSIVRVRYSRWQDNLNFLEESFKQNILTVAADRSIEGVAE